MIKWCNHTQVSADMVRTVPATLPLLMGASTVPKCNTSPARMFTGWFSLACMFTCWLFHWHACPPAGFQWQACSLASSFTGSDTPLTLHCTLAYNYSTEFWRGPISLHKLMTNMHRTLSHSDNTLMLNVLRKLICTVLQPSSSYCVQINMSNEQWW